MRNQYKLRNHRLYTTWHHMVERCTKKESCNYKYYGARGITVCDEWLDLNNFINDMFPTFQEGLTLDRIDNNKGYCKDNCRWATKIVQSRNTKLIHAHNRSGYRGVGWSKRDKKWRARIKVNSKEKSLGYFDSPIEAARAYDNYILLNNLEHTRNFN